MTVYSYSCTDLEKLKADRERVYRSLCPIDGQPEAFRKFKGIREKRKAYGWTQRELADKLGVTHIAVKDWERKKYKPSRERLEQLARVFGCPVDELIDKEETKPERRTNS